jgi:hypothetical protein
LHKCPSRLILTHARYAICCKPVSQFGDAYAFGH